MKKLNDLQIGQKAIIKSVNTNSDLKQRILDIGLVQGSIIYPVLKNKGMTAYNIKDAIIAIRKEDTKNIIVEIVK